MPDFDKVIEDVMVEDMKPSYMISVLSFLKQLNRSLVLDTEK